MIVEPEIVLDTLLTWDQAMVSFCNDKTDCSYKIRNRKMKTKRTIEILTCNCAVLIGCNYSRQCSKKMFAPTGTNSSAKKHANL